MLGRVLVGRGSGDGRLDFVVGFGRFKTWIHDEVEEVGGTNPCGLAGEAAGRGVVNEHDTLKANGRCIYSVTEEYGKQYDNVPLAPNSHKPCSSHRRRHHGSADRIAMCHARIESHPL